MVVDEDDGSGMRLKKRPVETQKSCKSSKKVKPNELLKKSKKSSSKSNSLPPGVHETSVGNYHVQVYYQGSNRSIGTFQTVEQACLASDIAQNMLEKDEALKLSAEECEQNFKLAKEAAWKEVEDGSISTHYHGLPNFIIDYLNECYSLNPYPYADQKDRIALVTGLNKMQVEDWMARARMEQRKKANRPSTTVSSVPGVKAGVQITIKELDAYMESWISKNAFSRDWVLNLMPSPSQKDQIVLDTGIERNRLEGWLCR